jgi:hypothetical protein
VALRWKTLGTEGLLASVVLLLLLLPLAAEAAQFGDFEYESSGTEITILNYTGSGGDVTIPDTIAGLPVTSIGGHVSNRSTRLTRVTIPDSVTSIELCAFAGCTGLSSITIPDSITSIEFWAFTGCAGLTNLIIGTAVTNIQAGAFAGCSSLTSVTISDGVVSIEGASLEYVIDNEIPGAFSGCTSLTRMYFGGNAPNLGLGVFSDSPAVIVFFRAGTAGWGTTFAGRPTALWIEPPVYSDWLPSTGLPTQYPNASAEADDPDEDSMSNYAEMLAGTNPTDRTSLLTLERVPRPNDLTEADRTAIGANQHALHFRSVPGKGYGVQWAESLDGPWNTTAVFTASTTQSRLVFDQPATHAFYRVILAQ